MGWKSENTPKALRNAANKQKSNPIYVFYFSLCFFCFFFSCLFLIWATLIIILGSNRQAWNNFYALFLRNEPEIWNPKKVSIANLTADATWWEAQRTDCTKQKRRDAKLELHCAFAISNASNDSSRDIMSVYQAKRVKRFGNRNAKPDRSRPSQSWRFESGLDWLNEWLSDWNGAKAIFLFFEDLWETSFNRCFTLYVKVC